MVEEEEEEGCLVVEIWHHPLLKLGTDYVPVVALAVGVEEGPHNYQHVSL